MSKTRIISPGSIPNHKLLKNLQLQGNYLSNDGGDEGIRVDDDGNCSLGGAGTTTTVVGFHEFETVSYTLKRYSDTDDYFKIQINPNGATLFTTVDDSGSNAADLLFSPQGDIKFAPGATSYFNITPDTKTASGTFDTTLDLIEILAYGSGVATVDDTTPTPSGAWEASQSHTNVTQTSTDGSGVGLKCNIATDGSGNPTFTIVTDAPSGGYGYVVDEEITFTDPGDTSYTAVIIIASITDASGGSDVHYGIRYRQTQTDLTGWDSVYLMHLYGGDAARTFAIQSDGKVGIGVADPASPLEIFSTSSQLKISYDESNYADISVADDGHLKLATTGTDADITLDAGASGLIRLGSQGTVRGSWSMVEGGVIKFVGVAGYDLKLESQGSADVELESTQNVILDAAGHVEFDGCAAGFDRLANYVDAADVTVDFTDGNKAHLDMTGGDISGTLSLKFPSVSGNFLLVVEQDGSTRTIAAFRALDSAGNSANNDGGTAGDIRWAGGSPPDLTDGGSKRDILSFYWDADEEVCYGVVTLNF